MASTPYGEEIQVYINEELKRRNINAAGTVVEGQDNFDYGVHIRGAIKGEHFTLKDAYSTGLSDSVKQQVTCVLDGLLHEIDLPCPEPSCTGKLLEPVAILPDWPFMPVKCPVCHLTGRRINLLLIKDETLGASWKELGLTSD